MKSSCHTDAEDSASASRRTRRVIVILSSGGRSQKHGEENAPDGMLPLHRTPARSVMSSRSRLLQQEESAIRDSVFFTVSSETGGMANQKDGNAASQDFKIIPNSFQS